MKKKILAWCGIGLLLAMYLVNLVLAFIDSEAGRRMLLASCVCTIMIPILLYFFILMGKKRDQNKEMKEDFEKLKEIEDGADDASSEE
ncbi:MAG: hypothetical protein KBS79_03895 [Lachnospiraceae bacterium]|nr:hypothetical protein [Candidatus Minthocola equi]